MAKLIYSAITALDGYVADKKGNFDWAGSSPLPNQAVTNGAAKDSANWSQMVVSPAPWVGAI